MSRDGVCVAKPTVMQENPWHWFKIYKKNRVLSDIRLMEEIRLTSWYGKYPIIYRVSYMLGGAGFLPSTVVWPFCCLKKTSMGPKWPPRASWEQHRGLGTLIIRETSWNKWFSSSGSENRLKDRNDGNTISNHGWNQDRNFHPWFEMVFF